MRKEKLKSFNGKLKGGFSSLSPEQSIKIKGGTGNTLLKNSVCTNESYCQVSSNTKDCTNEFSCIGN